MYADSENVSSKEIPSSSECVIARLLSGGERGHADHSDMRNAGSREMEKLRMEAPEKSGASMRGKGIRPSTFGTVHCALRGLALIRALSTTGPLQCALGLPRTLFTDTGRKWRLTLSMALS